MWPRWAGWPVCCWRDRPLSQHEASAADADDRYFRNARSRVESDHRRWEVRNSHRRIRNAHRYLSSIPPSIATIPLSLMRQDYLTPSCETWEHRRQLAARHSLQLLRSELRVAERHQLLFEEGWRRLLGGAGSSKCWAVQSSDLVPVMVAIGAKFRLASTLGERIIEAAGFYNDDGIDYLKKRPDELLVDIQLPPTNGWRASYQKLRRRGAFDFPVLGVAAWIQFQKRKGSGRDAGARREVVLGGIAPSPLE